MKKWLYLILAFGISGAQARSLGPRELVGLALERSPKFQNSVHELAISELQEKNAFANFLPSLDLSTVQGFKNGTPQEAESDWHSGLKLALSEKFYDNGTSIIEFKRAKNQSRKSQVSYQKERAGLCLALISEFYRYSEAQSIVDLQQVQYDILKKQFSSLEGQYRLGLKTRIDYLRFKARLQRGELDLKSAQNSAAKSLEEMKSFFKEWDQADRVAQESPGEWDLASLDLAPPALEEHYDYRISGLEKDNNQFDVDLQGLKYGPEIYLDSEVSYNNSDYLAGRDSFRDNRQTDWAVTLTFKYNLWDWGQRKRDFAVAKLQKAQKDNVLDSDLLALESKLNKLMLDLAEQRKNLALNKELVGLENQNYHSLEANYRNGRAAYLELISALDDYTQAKQVLIRNYFGLKISLAEYYFHRGRLYEEIMGDKT